MAGAIAEAVVFDGTYDPLGIENDWKLASRLLRKLGYRDNGTSLWDFTYNLLLPHCGMIERVARRLEHERTLTADEIDGLMGST